MQVIAERMHQINPECRIESIEDHVDANNMAQLLPGSDLIIDCIDSYRVKANMIAFAQRGGIPLITIGGAGGQRDPTRVRVSDLSRTEQDPLLAKTRRMLRTEFGFPSDPRRRFGVSAVWSDEPVSSPITEDEGPGCATPSDGSLNCAGFGSCMPVTASFGLAAAGHALETVAAESESGD